MATTPYPARFAPPPTETASTNPAPLKGGAATPAPPKTSRATTCADAEENPGDRLLVTQCLRARAWSWERRGIAIRRQNYLAGSFALPAGAATVGLAAGGNPRADIIVPLGLFTATYLAHTNAYARADQAVAYEKTTAAYSCLVDATTEWAASSKGPVNAAKVYLTLASTQTSDAVRRVRSEETTLQPLFDGAQKALNKLEATLATDVATAKNGRTPGEQAALDADAASIAGVIADARLRQRPSRAGEMDVIDQQLAVVLANADSQTETVLAAESLTGSRLLKRASDIDNLARAAVSAIQPTAQAVAVSGAASIKAPSPPAPQSANVQDTKATTKSVVQTKAVGAPCITVNAALNDHAQEACAIRDWMTGASQKTQTEENLTDKVNTFNAAKANFQQAVAAYAPADPNLGQQCTATFGDLAPLMGPTQAVQAVDHKAQFLISGGVAPYGFLPHDQVKITLTPISSNMARIEVATPATPGSWPIVLFDAHATPSQLTVTVESKS